ncbi:MAG: hypothetical protein CVV05_15535 [Gammaproteobacteria bacterium HGW-Gammaproteobacteria-1]|nr:MAG: hypothetical protein CVV05_15535 [Gammaproteobacteria bacterium HGW-Gammaproteobacteria-1]
MAMMCREGSPFVGQEEAIRVRLDWEWQSGRWVMVADQKDRLLAWASWYRVNAAALAMLRDVPHDEIVRELKVFDPAHGEHVYIATAIVAPWAPKNTYLRLYPLITAANPDAISIASHLVKRDGRVSWHQRFTRDVS